MDLKHVKFYNAAQIACNKINRVVRFECPLCGLQAEVLKSKYGWIQARCKYCDIWVKDINL